VNFFFTQRRSARISIDYLWKSSLEQPVRNKSQKNEEYMKYMMLIYSAEDAWTEEQRAECMAESTDLCHELSAQGRFLGASPLHPVATATCVRVRGGNRLTTDGPYAETTEQLGGYFLVEAANLDDAIAIAGRIPAVSKGTVEIRPVVELSGLPRTK
jgi:hypothetical protein